MIDAELKARTKEFESRLMAADAPIPKSGQKMVEVIDMLVSHIETIKEN